MRTAFVLLGVLGCGSSDPAPAGPDAPAPAPDAASADAPPSDAGDGVPLAGFGALDGMCGVLNDPELTGPSPQLVRVTFDFERRYVDPDDRGLLTDGGRRLAETPNAGGSSGLSEVFAFEQLARCELASLLKTETEIMYDQEGKITDLAILADGHKIGVSVTRAMTYPYGQPYTLDTARELMERKLQNIRESTANVSEEDRWVKQILAVLAWDDQAADTIALAWDGIDATIKADTVVVVSSTAGEDLFIYTNN